MKIFIRSDDEETFSSLLSFHYVRINDKIRALKVIRDQQWKTLEDHLRSNQKVEKVQTNRDRAEYAKYERHRSMLGFHFPITELIIYYIEHNM